MRRVKKLKRMGKKGGNRVEDQGENVWKNKNNLYLK